MQKTQGSAAGTICGVLQMKNNCVLLIRSLSSCFFRRPSNTRTAPRSAERADTRSAERVAACFFACADTRIAVLLFVLVSPTPEPFTESLPLLLFAPIPVSLPP